MVSLLKSIKKWGMAQAPSALLHLLPTYLRHHGFSESRITTITDYVNKAFEGIKKYKGVSESGVTRDAFSDILQELRLSREERLKMFKAAKHPVVSSILNEIDPRAIETLNEELSKTDAIGNSARGKRNMIRDNGSDDSGRSFKRAGDYPSISKTNK